MSFQILAISFSRKPRPPKCSIASLARVPKVAPPLKILDPPMEGNAPKVKVSRIDTGFTAVSIIIIIIDIFKVA